MVVGAGLTVKALKKPITTLGPLVSDIFVALWYGSGLDLTKKQK